MRSVSETIIDYYEGAYGYTIRMDIQMESWLTSLKEKIFELLRGDISSIDFSLMKDVRISGISSLELLKTDNLVFPCIRSIGIENSSISIRWLQDEEQLETLVGLIDGLLDSDKPGHQYLTNEEDGILVELAFRE